MTAFTTESLAFWIKTALPMHFTKKITVPVCARKASILFWLLVTRGFPMEDRSKIKKAWYDAGHRHRDVAREIKAKLEFGSAAFHNFAKASVEFPHVLQVLPDRLIARSSRTWKLLRDCHLLDLPLLESQLLRPQASCCRKVEPQD